QQGNGYHGTLAPCPARARPGVAPGSLGDQRLERRVEVAGLLQRPVDMVVAQNLPARRHAFPIACGSPGVVLHVASPPIWETRSASSAANAAGRSTIGRCPVPSIKR